MTPEHTLLLRCERFLNAVEALYTNLPVKYRTDHLATKSRAIRADIRALVPKDLSSTEDAA